MKKRILSVLLAVFLLLPVLCVPAGAAGYGSGTCGDNVTWHLENGVLTLEGTGPTWSYVGFNTPPWWTAPTKYIRTVVVGEGITSIGAGFFMGEALLEEISLPSTLKSIGAEAFSLCTNLKQIELPESITAIGNYAFDRCSLIEQIEVPDSVTYLGDGAFLGCAALRTVKLPAGLTTVGDSLFSDCTALESVNLPGGVTGIGAYAFQGCASLPSMQISAQITEIGEHAWENCTSLEGIWVDSENPNYASDEKGVLFNKDMTRILAVPGKLSGSYTLPETVTQIDSDAFRNCTGLTELIFPAGLTELSYQICEGCTALERVVLGENLTDLHEGAFLNCTALKEINIPGGVTRMKREVFHGCSSLVSLKLPEGITQIEDHAFEDCTSLESLNFPAALTEIGDYAFSNCTALKETVFPEGLKLISWNAFAGCESLTWVEIPASVDTIEEFAFAGCDSLEGFSVAEGNDSYVADDRNVLYNRKMTILVAAPNRLSGSYTVPGGVVTIYGGAFSGTGITEIHLPDTLRNIGWKAFTSCQGLTEVTIPDSVESIGMYAFSNCQNLEQVTLSQSVEKITEGMFYQCTGLKQIDIPASVEEIHTSAFSGCTAMEEVRFADTVKELDLSGEAFRDCDSLTSVTLPEGTAELWYGAFAFCDDLQEVTIPGSVYFIDEAVFHQCEELTDVHFQGTETRLRQVMDPSLNGDAVAVLRFDYEPACTGEHTAITDPAVDVECTTDGLTGGSHCGVCGTVLVAREVIPAPGHRWDTGMVTKEPTETEPGLRTYTCYNCDETKTEEIPVHTHSYAKFHYLPTCTQQGYVDYVCECGHTYQGDYTEALGHAWDGGTVTLEPTEYTEGCREFRCTRENCWERHTEVIPRLDHVHSYENGICTGCGGADPDWAAPVSVSRLAGDNRFLTAFQAAEEMKRAMGTETFDSILVASGINFADALSGSYLAAVKEAPILLSCTASFHKGLAETYNGMIVDYVRENLSEGGTVYILGGTAAVDASLDEALAGFNVRRLAGNNRYATNIAILEEAGYEGREVLICNGDGFADSLSASAAKLPILLVNSTFGLFDIQKEFLRGSSGQLYIIGGESAVSREMESDLGFFGAVYRVGGKNRFETSVLIAEQFFGTPESAVLAYAWNFPDGLCGGALASVMDAPLILTMDGFDAQAAAYVQENGIRRGVILGSSELISDETADNIFEMIP